MFSTGALLEYSQKCVLEVDTFSRRGLVSFQRCSSFSFKKYSKVLFSFGDFIIGNKAMQSKLYPDAIELYSFAIALCEDNAVYYCNRCVIITLMEESYYRFSHAKILLHPSQFM